jgi:hypothetical protein
MDMKMGRPTVIRKVNAAAIIASAAVSLLAGCGGNGKQDAAPAESSGVLQTRIQGVNYRTPTRSGKTDANGNFKYLPGETVTFSVGGIELGSAPGSSNISLFTLAGMTPPTSELGLRRDLDRMRYTVTPLSTAANRALLLLALDGDGNPGNGIDVSTFESALASANLSFDARTYEFAGKMSRLAPGMNNNIPQSFPIKWQYRTLGVKMAGSVPVRSVTDDQNDGVTDSTGWNELDTAGDIVSTLIDQDADGQPDVTVTYLRDSLGRVTRQRTIRDFDLNREPDSDHTVVTTYDPHGNAVHVVEWEDGDANGSIDSEMVSDSTFDAHGREMKTTYNTDINHDGTVDSIEVHTFTRDARGNLLRHVIEVDLEADGQVNGRYVSDYTWDASDRQLTSAYTRDLDGDGQVDTAWRSMATYSTTGTPQTYDEEYDGDGDGVYEQRSRSSYVFDSAGNARSMISDYQDPWSNYQTSGEFSYDRDRRPLSLVYSYDFDVDGTVDSSTRQDYTYDANGFQLSWKYASDTFGTGGPGSWVDSVSYTYSAAGAQTSSTSGTDFDGDGVLELSSLSVIEYAPSNDAMAQIVNQYLGAL